MAIMLWRTYTGAMHPVGGLGISTLVLVVLFPVVQPWYPLWAIVPLAAWATRPATRAGLAAYSAVLCFVVLPTGTGMIPHAVLTVYLLAAAGFAALAAVGWGALRHGAVTLDHATPPRSGEDRRAPEITAPKATLTSHE
ncbi:polyprenol phosphomannose-dependent alpha 1,6 mannosyltransferase MptB [Corynebacterium sp. CNCTC7651]|nr:polyprenol phosphomannose-dependent alpha 1,6 mannosyltransferase MptB [Corynebacterium sp. CNCTC7651]